MSTLKNVEHRKFAALHTWIGLFFGILLFVEIFVGAVVVFWNELQIWQMQDTTLQISRPISMKKVNAAVRAVALEYEEPLEGMQVVLPGPQRPLLKLGIMSADESLPPDERFEERYYDLSGEAKRVDPPRGVAEVLFDLHAHLLIPWQVSHILLGLLGMLMLVLIVSGVIIHKNVLSSAFTFRTERSIRLQWTDLHNRIGIWGLPFHLMIAVTAVPYALHETPWLLGMSVGATGGSLAPKEMVSLFSKAWPEPSGRGGDIANLAEILSDAQKRKPDVEWDVMRLVHPRDTEARVTLLGFPDTGASLAPTLVYNGVSGEFLREDADPIGQGSLAGGKVFTMMVHLHRGDFAGYSSKIVWFFLGLAGALLAVSGQMIWLERKQGKTGSQRESNRLHFMSNLTVGVTAGFVVAIASAILSQQLSFLISMSSEDLVLYTLFASWGLFTVWALRVRNAYVMSRRSMFLTAALCVTAVFLRWYHSGGDFLHALQQGRFVPAGVDCGLLIVSLLFAWIATQLPKGRRQRKTARPSSQDSAEFAKAA